MEKQREEERLREEMDGKELKSFREAVAAREHEANKPPPIGAGTSTSAATLSKPKAAVAAKPAVKKDTKKSLKGVLVKKKPKATAASPPAPTNGTTDKQSPEKPDAASKNASEKGDDESERPGKRRKVSDT